MVVEELENVSYYNFLLFPNIRIQLAKLLFRKLNLCFLNHVFLSCEFYIQRACVFQVITSMASSLKMKLCMHSLFCTYLLHGFLLSHFLYKSHFFFCLFTTNLHCSYTSRQKCLLKRCTFKYLGVKGSTT